MRDATQMPERQGDPSRTAEFVALFRALESRMPSDRRLFEDPYAHTFLGARLGAVLALARVPVTGRLVVRVIDRGWPGARVGIVLRTRFIDDAFAAALADGIDQIVILGSGFDTRAYRLPGLERARVIEIDAPATLQIKRTRMEALLGRLPPHVSMSAMDFERDDVEAALSRTEFRARAPTLFVWEGVTSYLSAAAVDATVRHLAPLAAPRSRVVFTYLDHATLEGRSDVPGARAAMAAVRYAGEPFRFGFDPAELPAYLDRRGFELLEDFSSAELAVRYLHPVGRRPTATRFYHVALATR
jgi:methyltransferase (TIGR00027 family)